MIFRSQYFWRSFAIACSLMNLIALTTACVTQDGYQPLVSILETPPPLEEGLTVSAQQERLTVMLGGRDRWKEAVIDVVLALQAQELEDQRKWETAAQKWLTVLQIDAGAVGALAFRHWVQNSEKVMGSSTSAEVMARLLLAQTKDGKASPWLQKQNLTKLERLTNKIEGVRQEPQAKTTEPAWPPDPSSMRDDPFWDKAAQFACGRELPNSWHRWARQLPAARRFYWDGLLAYCQKNYEAAVQAFQSALPLLEQEASAAALTINAADRLVQSQKRLGRREESAAAYRQQQRILLSTSLNPAKVGWSHYELLKRQAEAGLWVGRMQSLLGDYQNAKIAVQQSLDLINKGFTSIPDLTKSQRSSLDEQKADAYHIFASRIAYEQKDYTGALALTQVALGLPELGKEWRDRLRWSEGWYKYMLGDKLQAINTWQQLLEPLIQDGQSDAKLNFWIGRAYEEMGESRNADEYFERLKEEHTLNFYHVIAVPKLRPAYKWYEDIDLENARKRLEKREEFEAEAYARDPEAMRRLLRAELVIAAGVQTWTKPLTSELYKYVTQKNDLLRDIQASLYVSRLLHMAGQHQQVIALSTQLADLRKGLWEDYPEQLLLFFPRPYLTSYQRAAGQHFIETEITLAISRQESSFQAEAYSPAEAVGLMQLIAPTALRQASRLGLMLDAPLEDLKRPDLNISLGTAYLAELGRRYRGQWPQAFAAYNAGEYVVDAWMKRRTAPDLVQWIEGLSFGETSGYARNVWRNWEVYRILKATP